MKRCPKCNRKYNDDSLKFCLEDGSTLSVTTTRDSNPPPTEIMPPRQPTLQSSAGPTIPSYPNAGEFRPSESGVRQSNPVLTAGVVAIVLLLLALVGIAAFFVFKQSGGDDAKTDPTSSPAVKQGANDPVTSSTVKETSANSGEISSTNPQNTTPLKITASASSVRLAVQSNTYYPANAIDGKRSTCWMEGVDGPGLGEWLRFDFDRDINVHKILIQPGYFKSPAIWSDNNRIATLTAYFSDGTSRDLTFSDRMDSQKVDIGSVKTRWVKLVIKSVYYGTDPDTAISEIAFEWDQ